MAKRDILKEAIADAKTLKEAAIANAKAALEESFTPQLKSMLAKRIEEMDIEEDELTNEMLDSETNIERHGDEGDTDPEELETEKMAKKLEEDEEINLEEILKEIEEEDDKTISEADESEAERADVDKYEYEEGKEEGEEEEADEVEDDTEELDLEDMTDEDLKVYIEDVISDMVASGELEAGENFEGEEVSDDVDIEVEDDVDVDVEAEEEVEIAEQNVDPGVEPKSFLKKKPDYVWAEAMKKKEVELKEAYKALDVLRSEMKEVNLLNAKLLYTNKIFKSKNLTESQKVKVLGAFDNANTVKESKLVFETLKEGLKAKKKPIRESLGRASKATGITRTKKPIIAADPMVDRFQKLAGIK